MSKYFDDKGNIRKELLEKQAEEDARSFLHPDGRDAALNSAQLRKFYGDFKALEKKLASTARGLSEDAAFLRILPLIKMMKSKVAYASNPKKTKIPGAFKQWLNGHVDAIETVNDFRAFLLHFEAVVGFCYGHGMSNS
jgi:CRISPR-associated protein Csm2